MRVVLCFTIFFSLYHGRVPAVQASDEVEIHTVNPTDWLQQCFRTFTDSCCFSEVDLHIFYSNHWLIEKPSGLCTDHLSCAFEECSPKGFEMISVLPVDDDSTYEHVKDIFGTLNLPSKMVFPKTVQDVIHSIQYAKANNMTVSIKATSHSYTGSSTVGGSLQLNLRDFEKYTEEGVKECTINDDVEGTENYNACQLAKARGKKAFLKIGGGQTWSDAYLAVLNANNTSVRYDIVGGGAGSVGAAGGWLQGGGWSHGVERMYGLGVDQILEIEMILADETYIRFGPTKWRRNNNFIYPKTTKVEGECFKNNTWGACVDSEPPFEDLWFAVRGGGGGSFGLVTAVKYQLHEVRPFEAITRNEPAYVFWFSKQGEKGNGVELWLFFLIDLLYRPENLGIDKEVSSKCGHPAIGFNFNFNLQPLFCYDNVWSEILEEKWKERVDAKSDFDLVNNDLKNLWTSSNIYESFPAAANDFLRQLIPIYPEGKIPDFPTPNFIPDKGFGGWCSAVIPNSWLADSANDDVIFEIFSKKGGEHVTGGYLEYAHDQMSAIPPFQRRSGLSSTGLADLDEELQNRLLKDFLKDENEFPGITEVNHVCIGSYGPLKSDHSKICPREYSEEQKKEECISLQESIWGTEILSRLEDIKTKVDPDVLFDCNICIQPKKEADSSSKSTTNYLYSFFSLMAAVISTYILTMF